MKKILIIGGGISGLCSAYYLIKEGFSVTILDQGDMESGASYINAGYITPSHFIPLAAPGMISKGLKWMLNSSSPFYIKPRWDTDFFRWALDFKRSANVQRVENAIPALKELNLQSQILYEELLATLDFEFHYEKKGVLLAYGTPKAEEEELEVAHRAVKEGLEVDCLSKEALHELEPVFSDHVTGAVHYKCDSHTTPNEFMGQLKSWLVTMGANFELRQQVKGFQVQNGHITGVETQNNLFTADEYVLASGSWTSPLVRSLGLYIPVQGGKGYSMDVYRETGIAVPAILVEAKVAVTPMKGFSRFAGTMEFSGNNSLVRRERVEALASAVKKYYRSVEIQPKEKEGAVSGLRPVSPDGLPFIGKTLKYDNLTLAAGHAMMGWSLGPITGKLVTQGITKEKTTVDLRPFRPERFQ
ncbi:MAG: FAD-dependent oxidoreductase [Sediminicola sp.]